MQDPSNETPEEPKPDPVKILQQMEAELAAARISRPAAASKRSAYRLAGILILIVLLLVMLGLAYYFTAQLPESLTPAESNP